MNAQLPAAPAMNVAAVPQGSQSQPEAMTAADTAALPEGGFRGVLEQRMKAPATEPAPEKASDSLSPESAGASAQIAQSTDFNQLSMDALAAFMTTQALALRQQPDAAGVSAAEDAGLSSQLKASFGRDLATEWQAFGRTDRPGTGLAASDSRDDPSARMLAAMDADTGRKLPQLAAAAAATAMPALGANAATVERAADSFAGLLATADGSSASLGAVPNQLSASLSAPPSDPRAVSTQVATPFGRPEWTGALSERVSWLVGQRLQSAEIQINPPQLGPVEVRISIQNDQATLMFASGHSVVREAIQAALPRLNEMLAQSGIALGQTSVGAESFAGQQQGFRQSGGQAAAIDPGLAAIDPMTGQSAAESMARQGLMLLRGSGGGIDMFV